MGLVGRTACGSRPTVLFRFGQSVTLPRLLVAIPALFGLSLATSAVRAQPQAASADAALADAVELKNGGYLRGLIVEMDPASHISVRLPDGQVRVIPIAEIESAERGGKALNLTPPPGTAALPSASAAPAAPPPAAAANAPTPAPAGQGELDRILAAIPGPRMRLEAVANRPAFLERRIGEADDDDVVAYHLVCKLPCRVDLPAADVVPYRIANLRLQPTGWFQLPKYNARVHADLASDMWPVWTRSMLVGGFVFGIAGGSMLGINELSGKKPWARDTGFVLAGLGGAFFVTSGLFWLFSPHTSYELGRAP
jgi:hypothetical protein